MNTNRKRCILEVPFLEKDEAKNLGAWWDPQIKKWFVPAGIDVAAFRKWLPADKKQTAAPK